MKSAIHTGNGPEQIDLCHFILRTSYISDPQERADHYYSIGAVVAAVAAEVRLIVRGQFFIML
jgi:hypothetical protein